MEDIHGVPIDLVVTGDRAYEPHGAALTQAMREACSTRSGTAARPVTAYVEIGPTGVEAFVRDRGDGFDVDAVPGDRLGVRQSILGRMERHGGPPACAAATTAPRWSCGCHRSKETPMSTTQPATPVRVVLVDDHRMFRTGVQAELTEAMTAGGVPACELVGEAADVDAAIAVNRAERPDVVLLDVHLPGGSGRRRRRDPRVHGGRHGSGARCGSWRCRSPTPPRT